MTTLILIPSRLDSVRFPNKPLVDIIGTSMIMRVYNQAIQVEEADVYVACGDELIFETVVNSGGKAILTDRDLPSGTDRIHQALEKLQAEGKFLDIEYVINLQGDLPFINVETLIEVKDLLSKGADIVTACTEISKEEELSNSNVVKVYGEILESSYFKAKDFSRETFGEKPFYHHIGIYGYRLDSLRNFVKYEQSFREKRDNLEQLRALDNGMSIDVCIVNDNPLGIDTEQDLKDCLRTLQKI